MRGRPPIVWCVCPTYGRFKELRQALTCFLHQTYPHKRLVILNDSWVPIECDFPDVEVINHSQRFETLGHKRQALLEAVRGPLVAHWDDDDLYLPWHLEKAVEALSESQKGMVRPARAWRVYGATEEELELREPKANRYEGQVVFQKETALACGGYTPMWSGQCKRMMSEADKRGEFFKYHPKPSYSYVYRWKSGVSHISSRGNTLQSHLAFAALNNDFGDGMLLPANLTPFYGVFAESVHRHLEAGEAQEFMNLLEVWRRPP